VKTQAGPFIDTWRVEQGKLVRQRTNPLRSFILERNKELQKQPDVISDMTFGGLELIIPLDDLHALWRKYPELNCPEAETKTKAWRRFFASSEADPYRVRPRRRARAIDPVTRRETTEQRMRKHGY
jgi:hypothetical protein